MIDAKTQIPGKRQRIRLSSTVILLFSAFVATLPLLIRGPSCGDDFHFHLSSWVEAQRSWKLGIVYPHWAWAANFGAGEPRFVFYPPLTWMLGALLGLVLPWTAVPAAMTFLLIAGTAFATRLLAREHLGEQAATLAGCTAIFFGYPLYVAYGRAAFAELSGGLWIPLILLFVLRQCSTADSLSRRTFDGSAVPLAICLAGALLSNAPLGLMALYLIAAVALIAAILDRSPAPILRAFASTFFGIGLSAIYLLPAIYQQRWVDIAQAIHEPGARIEDNWLFEKLSNPLIWWHDKELQRASILVVAMGTIAIASALFVWRRGIAPRRWWIPLALVAPAVFLLQLPWSLPIWNALPKLRYLQFPWRLLLILEAPMAILFAASVYSLRLRTRLLVLAGFILVCIAATTVAGRSYFVACRVASSVSEFVPKLFSVGTVGNAEYGPPGTSVAAVTPDMPAACLEASPGSAGQQLPKTANATSCEVAFDALGRSSEDKVSGRLESTARGGEEHVTFTAVLPRSGYLLLHLRAYPAWRLTLNGRTLNPEAGTWQRADGMFVIPVTEGPVHLDVDWTATPDVIAARWASGISVLLLALLFLAERHGGHTATRPRDGIRLSSDRCLSN
jgi:hypothetical protein